jgi:serine/threonine protein kinase
MAGTVGYMAPEQIRGNPCAASDQYALGVMVYEWLCGEPPFHGPLDALLSQHLSQPPPSLCERLPQLHSGVENTVFGALAKDPLQRFPCVQDFAMVLEDACSSTQPLPPISPPIVSESISLSASPSPPAMRFQDHPLSPTNKKEEAIQDMEPIKLFYCYAPEDRKLRDQLETHLMVLKRLRQITLQLNREILAGTDWRHVQDERFHMADLILLLISPDFIASAYHYGIEMHNALEKHKAGNVRVIPILLRPTPLWQETPLGTLQILPKNGKAITEHTRRDMVLADIVKTIGEEVS